MYQTTAFYPRMVATSYCLHKWVIITYSKDSFRSLNDSLSWFVQKHRFTQVGNKWTSLRVSQWIQSAYSFKYTWFNQERLLYFVLYYFIFFFRNYFNYIIITVQLLYLNMFFLLYPIWKLLIRESFAPRLFSESMNCGCSYGPNRQK